MQLSRKRIRLQIDASKIGQPIIDLNTGQTPAIFAGTDVQVEIGLFQNGALLDIGNLANLQIDLKIPGNLLGPSVFTVVLTTLDNSTTFGAWNSGAQQHGLVTLTNAQTNLGIPSPQTLTLVISATTTDNPGRLIVYGSTPFTITPTGINGGANPPPAVPTFYTGNQADARYLQLAGPGQVINQPVTLSQGVTLGQIPISASSQALTLPPLPGASNSNLVPVGPYVTLPSAGNANFGPSAGQTSLELINTSHFWRIRQDGNVSALKLYLPSAAGITGFFAKIWRLNAAGSYDLAGQSDNCASSLSAGTISHTLSTPIPNVREGDFIGFRVEWSGGAIAQNFCALNNAACYSVSNVSPLAGTYNWAAQTSNNLAVPLQLLMPAPWFVVLGDSLMSGRPASLSYADSYNNPVSDSPADSFPWHLGRALGLSYQNMGVSGQTAGQIASRIQTDCNGLSPRFAILEGGVNDLLASIPQQSVLAPFNAMLAACQAAGILPVVLLVAPFRNYGGASTGIMTNRDALNSSLLAFSSTYNAIFVDPNPALGAPASDGPNGNLWALQTQYDSGDGIHLNSAGYARLAQAVAQALCSIVVRGHLTAGGLALNGNLTLDGQSPRKLGLERNSNYQAVGASLALRAGGASVNGPNLAGGPLLLSSGLSTGAGFSSVIVQTAPAGVSGTADNPPTQRFLLRQSAGFSQCNLYADAGNGAQFALYPNGGSAAIALYAPRAGVAGLASGSANPQPILGVDASDNITIASTLTVGSPTALSPGGSQFCLTSPGLTRLAVQSTGVNNAQALFYNGSTFKYAIGWDQPADKFAIYSYLFGGSSPILTVDSSGNLFAQGAGVFNGNSSIAGTLAVSASATIGGVTNAGESLLCVQGNGSYTNSAAAIAKFMANGTHGLWFGYDIANHAGLIGASTEGLSNDNLGLCTQGGSCLIGSPVPLAGTGFSNAQLQVAGTIAASNGAFLANTLTITAGGAIIAGAVSVAGNTTISSKLAIGASSVSSASAFCVLSPAGVVSSNAIAKFMLNSTKGLWFSYDASNNCGLIGASTDGLSNDNLALCTQGGALLVGGIGADTGSGAILQIHGEPQFSGANTTGAAAAALGANCPAVTPAAPYTWVRVITSDGSTAYLPLWK